MVENMAYFGRISTRTYTKRIKKPILVEYQPELTQRESKSLFWPNINQNLHKANSKYKHKFKNIQMRKFVNSNAAQKKTFRVFKREMRKKSNLNDKMISNKQQK